MHLCLFIVIDTDENQAAVVMLQYGGIMLFFDLSDRCIVTLIPFQLDQQCRQTLAQIRQIHNIRDASAGGQLLNLRIAIFAYDISKLLSTEHLKFYSDLVSKELAQEENSELIYHFMRYWGGDMDDIDDNYDTCRLIWSVIGDILLSELKKRVRYED